MVRNPNPLLLPAKTFSMQTIADYVGVSRYTMYDMITHPEKHKIKNLIKLCHLLRA